MTEDRFVDVHPDDERWGHLEAEGVDGIRIHLVRRGEGSPVLLLHGWPGFWYDWRRVIPLLEDEALLLAPDLRGFGRSDAPAGSPVDAATPFAMAGDMGALLESEEPAVVVGHDVGAAVAQALAIGRPDRVRALVLCNPPYLGIGARIREYPSQREAWYQHLHALPWAHELIGAHRETVRTYLSHFYDHWVTRTGSVRGPELDAIVEAYARPGRVEASLGVYRSGVLQAAGASDPDAGPFAIDRPTTVLWGDSDPVLPVEWSDRIPEFFPRSTLRVLPGVGHFVPFEAPEEVAAAIRGHLS